MNPSANPARAQNPRRKRAQSGYILLLLIITIAILAILMTAAATRMAFQMKRDRETEMIHRGEQYARAVKKFVKKTGSYPNTIEQLEKTNNIRFLRKRYKDPMTPDGKWKLVRQNDLMGLAGLGGTPLTGASPILGSSSKSSDDKSDQRASSTSSGASSGTGGGSLFSGSLTGQTFGGGPIYGVASMSEDKGIREFNNKKRYNQWLFAYVVNNDPCQSVVTGQMTTGCIIKGPYNPQAGTIGSKGIGTKVEDLNKQNQQNQTDEGPK